MNAFFLIVGKVNRAAEVELFRAHPRITVIWSRRGTEAAREDGIML